MSQNRLTFPGLEELRQALRNLPAELAAEARPIVINAARAAENQIRAAYPFITGELRDGMKVEILEGGRFGAAARVINTHKAATWYEYGTRARHYFTKKTGKLHAVGAMPVGKKFVPRIEENRRRMYEELRDLLKRRGLLVSG